MAILGYSVDIPVEYSAGNIDGQMEHAFSELRERFREEDDHPLVGKVLNFPVADGYARYMVKSVAPKLMLIHLNVLDGYTVHPAMLRGLILTDVMEMCEREDRLRELFTKHRGNA